MHADVQHLLTQARREDGQGTIEYVGLIMLLAAILAAVVAAARKGGDFDLTKVIVEKIKTAIGESSGAK
ncbi:MAG TPA: hypothetical protein VD931_06975 [Baekduia sp.]|nr:hypothetical protein [Baekduia sp.]